MSNKLPEQARIAIVDFYISGKTVTETARHFCVRDTTVSEILNCAGVVRKRGSWTAAPLSNSEKEEIIKLYSAGVSATDIAIKIRRRIGTISGFLKDEHAFRNHGSWSIGVKPANANLWDEDFFKRDCPVTAYWAGFIFADGSIGEIKVNDRLTLTSTDIDHMVKFIKDTGFSAPVDVRGPYERQKLPHGSVRLTGSEIRNDLVRWGIVPAKTYNFVAPDIPLELMPHYIRGWFDGDGYFRERHNKEAFRITTCVGAEEWCAKQFRLLGYTGRIGFERKDGQAWSKIVISGRKNLIWVFNAIAGYPRLDRKWDRIDAFLKATSDSL